ncbi:MAG: response regulator [Alphaproteobacteria bacterium]|nr:response regulator [Alphaproteobacteria bacterium]MCD8519859.1 response regulator [Alphaproteobacteria bacterium]MCD8571026.1 response regulator [Alphaproteobacteria bacterium]
MSETKKILVVEDNNFVRMQIVKFLQAEGFETVEGMNGDEAIQKIDSSVDLAIVDVRMEPINGFEFIKVIRADDYKTPVILVTGDQDPELLSDASRMGVAAVLMKPVQRDRLIKTVVRTIETQSRKH